jgi:hypothetical protein
VLNWDGPSSYLAKSDGRNTSISASGSKVLRLTIIITRAWHLRGQMRFSQCSVMSFNTPGEKRQRATATPTSQHRAKREKYTTSAWWAFSLFLGIHLTYGQTATNVSGARSNVVVVLSVRDARALELNASIFRRMRLCIEGPSENQFLSFMGSRANGVKANSKN